MCVKHAVTTLRMYEDCQQVSKGIWVESSNQVHYAVDSWYFAQIGSLGMYQKHLYANYLCFVRRCWSIVQMLGVWLFCAPWHLYRVPVSSCFNWDTQFGRLWLLHAHLRHSHKIWQAHNIRPDIWFSTVQPVQLHILASSLPFNLRGTLFHVNLIS